MPRGKKKSSKKLGKGEKWVTINGTPVLLGADGKLKGKVGKKIMADRLKNRGKKSGKGYSSEDARMDRERKKNLAAIQKAMDKQVAGVPDDYDERQNKAQKRPGAGVPTDVRKKLAWLGATRDGSDIDVTARDGTYTIKGIEPQLRGDMDDMFREDFPGASVTRVTRRGMDEYLLTPTKPRSSRGASKKKATKKRAAKVKPPVQETRSVRLAREQAEKYKPGTVGHERFDSYARLKEARARKAPAAEIKKLESESMNAYNRLEAAQKKIEKSVRDTAEEFRKTRKAAKQGTEYSDDPVPGGKRAISRGNAAIRRAQKKMQDPEYVRAGEAALTKQHRSIGGIGDHPSVKPKKATKKKAKRKVSEAEFYAAIEGALNTPGLGPGGSLTDAQVAKIRSDAAKKTAKKAPKKKAAKKKVAKKLPKRGYNRDGTKSKTFITAKERAALEKKAKKATKKKATKKKVAKKKTTKKRKSNKPSQAEIDRAMRELFGG